MARPVDERKYQQRRLQIIDAALTCFAAKGFDRSTTAEICRTAGIGSGTLFHYFPTKIDILISILETGQAETEELFARFDSTSAPLDVITSYISHEAADLSDERAAGFVRVVGAMMFEPQVATELNKHRQLTERMLLPWINQARDDGTIRNDLSAKRLLHWILALVDGFASAVTDESFFDATCETAILHNTIARFLRPEPSRRVPGNAGT